jgi:hypothetical protein
MSIYNNTVTISSFGKSIVILDLHLSLICHYLFRAFQEREVGEYSEGLTSLHYSVGYNIDSYMDWARFGMSNLEDDEREELNVVFNKAKELMSVSTEDFTVDFLNQLEAGTRESPDFILEWNFPVQRASLIALIDLLILLNKNKVEPEQTFISFMGWPDNEFLTLI